MENEKSKKKINPWLIYWVFFGIILLFAVTNARADEQETTEEESSSFDFIDVYPYQFLDTDQNTIEQVLLREDTYTLFKPFVETKWDVELPDYATVNELTKNLYAYVLGNYVECSAEVWDTLVYACTDPGGALADLGQYIMFDTGLGQWVFDDDIEEYVKSGVDHYIRVRTDSKIGEWIALPVTYQNSNDNGGYQYRSDYAVYTTYITNGNNGQTGTHYFAIRSNSSATAQERVLFDNGSTGNWTNFNVDIAYTGTEYSGYYKSRGSGRLLPSSQGYASMSDALADFFGDTEEEGGYQIQGAHIVNDNFHVAPLSIFPSTGYSFSDAIVNNYDDETVEPWDPQIVNYYPSNNSFEVPYWLVTPSTFSRKSGSCG